MDLTAIATAATDMSQTTTADLVQLVMLKKAMTLEAEAVAQPIAAAVQVSQAINPPHLGNSVNTFV